MTKLPIEVEKFTSRGGQMSNQAQSPNDQNKNFGI